MRKIGIEYISVFGLPPVEYVHLAADLGCVSIGTGLTPFPYNPQGYPAWSLRDDRALRQRMRSALRERDISISLGEGFFVMPRMDVSAHAAGLDAMQELGVKCINTLGLDPDKSRTLDQFAKLVAMAAERGMATTLEFGPRLGIDDLQSALAAVRYVARPEFRLVIDTMHWVRSGSSAADVAAVDPNIIGYVQLCDAPLVSEFADYADEAKFERRVPGEGELPLLDILAQLPAHLTVSLEVPQRSLAERGVGPRERLARCVAATRELLAQLDAAND